MAEVLALGSSMARRWLAAGLILLHLAPLNANADEHRVPEVVHEAILQSIELFFNNQYLECIRVNKEMQGSHGHLLSYLFEAAGYFYIMYDYRNLAYKETFEAKIEAVIEKSKEAVESEPKNPWGRFALGSAYAYRGAYKAQILDRWFSGYLDGLKAKGLFEELLEADGANRSLTDVYYGMGMFLFWRGYYTARFAWLVPSKGQKEKGILYLKRSTGNGVYTRYFSQASLIQVYYANNEHGKAIRAADDLLDLFPDYIHPYYYLALINFERGNTKETIRMKERIVEKIGGLEHVGSIGMARIKYQLGEHHYELEDHQKALPYFNEVLLLQAGHPSNEKELRKLHRLSERRIKKSKKFLSSSAPSN